MAKSVLHDIEGFKYIAGVVCRESERGGKSNKVPRWDGETRVLENEVRFTEEQKICGCTPEVCRSLLHPLSPLPRLLRSPFSKEAGKYWGKKKNPAMEGGRWGQTKEEGGVRNSEV